MKKNVYVRAQKVVRELPPLIATVHKRDRKLADQLRRAAQSVVLNIAEARGNKDGNARVAALDKRLDEVCAITWCLGRKP